MVHPVHIYININFQEQQIPRSLAETNICYRDAEMSSAVSKVQSVFLINTARSTCTKASGITI